MSLSEIDFAELEREFCVAPGWPWDLGEAAASCVRYLGEGFPVYARMLHPLFEDLSVGDWEQVWEDSEDADYGRGELEESFPARGLKWHDLAEDLDFDYEPGMPLRAFLEHLPKGRWPRALVGPVDGSLDMERLRQVLRLTREQVNPGSCVFGWVPQRCFAETPRAYRGPLESLSELYDGEHTMGAPSFWGDEARSFRFVAPPDRPWTLLAGPAAWIEELCEHKPLDAERLDPGFLLRR
ncbi:MAG: hypothetical protein CSA62_07810 [Planctomycetota bacterium]|nr:MAG: hypothetical protein CSA62_07810 [Planctomycetota bacterium]